jgi:hypothetical protein
MAQAVASDLLGRKLNKGYVPVSVKDAPQWAMGLLGLYGYDIASLYTAILTDTEPEPAPVREEPKPEPKPAPVPVPAPKRPATRAAFLEL